jgi:hypothetical protein
MNDKITLELTREEAKALCASVLNPIVNGSIVFTWEDHLRLMKKVYGILKEQNIEANITEHYENYYKKEFERV